MVIGQITSLGSLILFFVIAGLFLRQASQTSFGSAGQDVGQGLTGISSGISNLFGSVINPITGIFTSFQDFFNFGNIEGSGRADNTYGTIRDTPTANTSRVTSAVATHATVSKLGGYVASSRDTGGGTLGSGAFGSRDTSSGWGL